MLFDATTCEEIEVDDHLYDPVGVIGEYHNVVVLAMTRCYNILPQLHMYLRTKTIKYLVVNLPVLDGMILEELQDMSSYLVENGYIDNENKVIICSNRSSYTNYKRELSKKEWLSICLNKCRPYNLSKHIGWTISGDGISKSYITIDGCECSIKIGDSIYINKL